MSDSDSNSPDFALNFVLSGMNQTSKTFDISIYQVPFP